MPKPGVSGTVPNGVGVSPMNRGAGAAAADPPIPGPPAPAAGVGATGMLAAYPAPGVDTLAPESLSGVEMS